jgi:hypothetical protein
MPFFYPKNKKELHALLSSNRMEYPVKIGVDAKKLKNTFYVYFYITTKT